MSRLARFTVVLTTFFLAEAGIAWACSCAPSDPSELLARDRIVAVRIDAVHLAFGACATSSMAKTRVVAEVVEVVQGDDQVGDVLRLDTAWSGASCGMGDILEDGDTWLLFLDDGEVDLGLCEGHTQVVTDVDDIIDALNEQVEEGS